jgi:autotransporter translocation and assembly factor TamB
LVHILHPIRASMTLESSTSGTRPRSRRRLARILAIFGIAVVVLVAVLILLLHTSPARRFVATQVTSLLRQQNVEFATDELSYNLLALRLSP